MADNRQWFEDADFWELTYDFLFPPERWEAAENCLEDLENLVGLKPGDRVLLGGIRGDVIDISLLRTTLMELGEWVKGDQYNGRIVRVANSFVFKEAVLNYSADFPFLWPSAGESPLRKLKTL